MTFALQLAEAKIKKLTVPTLLETSVPDIMKSRDEEGKPNIFKEKLSKLMEKNSSHYHFTEESANTMTRRAENFNLDDPVQMIEKFILIFWKGVKDRMQAFDLDGTTVWSEAPAEYIFSVWQRVIEGRGNLTVAHTEAFHSRILKASI